MRLDDQEVTNAKNRRKKIRTAMQLVFLLAATACILQIFFNLKTYQPYPAADRQSDNEDTGFIALSYFGVDRSGDTSTLIGAKQLGEQMQVLKDQGYVTITQQDIERYYEEGTPLPRKALFLMFEDGRRYTAVFAQDILEDLNYKATMMTYPEKFEKKDREFLTPSELKDMESSTFWEIGTNGYRLKFINVFDRYDNYIGEIDPLRHSMMREYLGRKYNHYLMDYIRDKNGMPKESYRHMESRIDYDYEKLRDIYEQRLGYVPQTYVLMHANTGKFGNNDKVSAVNEKWMRKLFKMNFNREGYCFNQRNSSIYDLTRMQPQPYWSMNHLLMRIKYDINQPVDFVVGDEEKQAKWELVDGAAESRGETYILTSVPLGQGLARLRNSGDFTDVIVSARLDGNSFGAQQIYLRADDQLTRYISVGIVNGQLVVKEAYGGVQKELYRQKLDVIDGKPRLSVAEDKRAAEVRELEVFAEHADSRDQAEEYLARAKTRKSEPAASIADGAPAYEGADIFQARLNRQLEIALKGNTISVLIDGRRVVDNAVVMDTMRGSLYLGAAWNKEAWSQRNLADDVYDGIFARVVVTTNTGAGPEKETVLFSTEFTGWEKAKLKAENLWEGVLGWFLRYF